VPEVQGLAFGQQAHACCLALSAPGGFIEIAAAGDPSPLTWVQPWLDLERAVALDELRP